MTTLRPRQTELWPVVCATAQRSSETDTRAMRFNQLPPKPISKCCKFEGLVASERHTYSKAPVQGYLHEKRRFAVESGYNDLSLQLSTHANRDVKGGGMINVFGSTLRQRDLQYRHWANCRYINDHLVTNIKPV